MPIGAHIPDSVGSIPTPATTFELKPQEEMTTKKKAKATETPEPNKHIKLELRYDFTDAEITQIAKDQGQKMRDKAICEDEKKRSAKQYALRIETMEGEIEADTDKITSGYEMRLVECAVFYHSPKQGIKSIVRTDTGTMVREERMTETECQSTLPLEDEAEETAEETQKALPGDTEDWKLIDKEHPEYGVRVMFRNGEGAQRIGKRDTQDGVDVIVSEDADTVELSTAIAWRPLTADEAEQTETPEPEAE